MGAPDHAAQQLAGFAAKILKQIESDEPAIHGIGLGAKTAIGRPLGRLFGVDDGELAVDVMRSQSSLIGRPCGRTPVAR